NTCRCQRRESMRGYARPGTQLRESEQEKHQPVVEVLSNRERAKVNERASKQGHEQSRSDDHIVGRRSQAAAKPDADRGNDKSERQRREQLLDHRRTSPMVRSYLVVEIRQQDASPIG